MKDTEVKATKRYLEGGFGSLKTKIAYKRYVQYVIWLKKKLGK